MERQDMVEMKVPPKRIRFKKSKIIMQFEEREGRVKQQVLE